MCDNKRLRRQKERMFNNDPHCMECGVKMWLNSKNDKFRKGDLNREQIDTMATIGHKYSKYDERRITEPHESKRHRLICHKCNQFEQFEDTLKQPIEELHKRSKQHKGRKNEQNKKEIKEGV